MYSFDGIFSGILLKPSNPPIIITVISFVWYATLVINISDIQGLCKVDLIKGSGSGKGLD
jgi:hypothetical protein